MSQIIAMNKVDGSWKYTDPTENDLVYELEIISGIDLTSYDVLLNDSPQWAGHDAKRQRLAALRRELNHIFKRHFADTERLALQVKNYHQAFDSVRMHITGMELETARNSYRKSQSERRAGKGNALTLEQEKQVISRYRYRLQNGEKYGAVRDLAATFRTSETTIKNLLKNAK